MNTSNISNIKYLIILTLCFNSLRLFSKVNKSTLNLPLIKTNKMLDFTDDLDFKFLKQAIKFQKKAFSRIRYGSFSRIKFGKEVYPISILKDSLVHFEKLLDQYFACTKIDRPEDCRKDFNLAVNQDFTKYLPLSGKENKTKFTAYYSPDVIGSLNKTAKNINPIYSNPGKKNPKYNSLTRDDIDYKNALAGKGFEIAYTQNSHFDLYLMMVEGGGRLVIPQKDGSKKYKYLSYNGSNKQPLRFISRYLLAKGYMTRSEIAIRNQRQFLLDNPHLEREVMSSNPSYTYFKITDSEPLGIDSIPLTVERSVAIDRRIYKFSGYLNFIQARRPFLNQQGKLKFAPMNMFRISQDTGGAIRGPGRMDIYFGFGDDAELAANFVNEMGMNYFLVYNN